jgi:hypothetical protein
MRWKDRRRRSFAGALAAALSWGCGAAGGGFDGRSLSSAEPEAAGDHCPAGGQRILTGIDANGDGLLQPGEVLRIAYVCNRQPPATCTTLEGSVVVRNPFDWANLLQAGCTRITGTLEIAAPGVTSLGAASPLVQVGRLEVWGSPDLSSLRFPTLAAIDDALLVSNAPALAELQLPALARVGGGGLQVFGAPLLTAIDLPALTTVEGTLQLDGHPRVTRVSLPSLTAVGSSIALAGLGCTALRLPALTTAVELYVAESPALVELEAPVLTGVSALILLQDPALTSISTPALASATAVQITGLPALATLDLSALEVVDQDLSLQDLPSLTGLPLPVLGWAGYLTVEGTSQLTDLELPSLTGAWYVTVSRNAALERLVAPSLTAVDLGLTITDNPALPPCQAEAVLARLQPPLPTQVALGGNGGTASCP